MHVQGDAEMYVIAILVNSCVDKLHNSLDKIYVDICQLGGQPFLFCLVY